MAIRIITYDLKKELSKHDYQGFYDYIKKHSWARLSESSYAILSDASPTDIFNILKQHIDSNDLVLILALSRPYYGQHKPEVIHWLDANL